MANLAEHLAEQDAITAAYEAAAGLQFFPNDAAALAYIRSELLATLRDDLARQEGEERHHYDDADRAEMRARIADLESIMPRLQLGA